MMNRMYRRHLVRCQQYMHGPGFEREKALTAGLRADPTTLRSYVLAMVKKKSREVITDSDALERACDDVASHALSLRTFSSEFERKLSWVMWKRLFGIYPDDDRNYCWQREQRNMPSLEWQQYRFGVTFEFEASFIAVVTKDLLMLDYDLKDGCTIDCVVRTIRTCVKLAREQGMRLCFTVWVTDGGVHVFEMSRGWDHGCIATLDLMSACGCDPLYCCMTEYRGFAMRILPKIGNTDDFVVRPGYRNDLAIESVTKQQTMESLALKRTFTYRSLVRPTRAMKPGYVIGDIQAIDSRQFALVDMRFVVVQYFRALEAAGIPYHGDALRNAVDLHLDRVVRNFSSTASGDPKLISNLRCDINQLYLDCLTRHDG